MMFQRWPEVFGFGLVLVWFGYYLTSLGGSRGIVILLEHTAVRT
jgi:hypothetical protein